MGFLKVALDTAQKKAGSGIKLKGAFKGIKDHAKKPLDSPMGSKLPRPKPFVPRGDSYPPLSKGKK